MKIRFGVMRFGKCWKLLAMPTRTAYWSGEIVRWGWWKFFVVFDRRKRILFEDLSAAPKV